MTGDSQTKARKTAAQPSPARQAASGRASVFGRPCPWAQWDLCTSSMSYGCHCLHQRRLGLKSPQDQVEVLTLVTGRLG